MRTAVYTVLLAVLAAGCGSNSPSGGDAQPPARTTTATVTTTHEETSATTTSPEKSLTLRLYFLAPDGELAAVSRDVEQTQTPGAATLRELTDAPSAMKTEVPAGLQLTIGQGQANVTGAKLNPPALAQVVYALTTFPT